LSACRASPAAHAARVTYLHVLLERHEIIRTAGTWSESYFPGVSIERHEDEIRRQMPKRFAALAANMRTTPLARPQVRGARRGCWSPRASRTRPGVSLKKQDRRQVAVIDPVLRRRLNGGFGVDRDASARALQHAQIVGPVADGEHVLAVRCLGGR
jgi:hypothetical protein